MALHAARVIRQRHKAEADMLEVDISSEQRKVLEEAFEAADKNGDGILSADEYYDIFQSHGLTIGKQEYHPTPHLTSGCPLYEGWDPLRSSLLISESLAKLQVDGKIAKHHLSIPKMATKIKL